MNINAIKNTISRVTANGAALLRREAGLNAERAAQEGLRMPQNAVTYDAVRVGRNFDHEKYYTDVFTFRDESGEILNRYIRKIDGDNIVETKQGFNHLDIDDDSFRDDGLNVSARKIRSYIRENGRITSITEDVFAKTDEAKPVVTHYKRTITPGNDNRNISMNYETILLEQRRNGEAPKFINNKYETDKDGIYNPGTFNLVESSTSDAALDRIAQNSYFLPYVSPQNKFAYRLTQATIKDADIFNPVFLPHIVLYRDSSARKIVNDFGSFSDNLDIRINLGRKGAPLSRDLLVNTIGHEVGHYKWHDKCVNYQLCFRDKIIDKNEFFRMYDKNELPKIKKYAYAEQHYVQPGVNHKEYRKNYAEVVAREEGDKALDKYNNLKQDIESQFPYKHTEQFYASNDFDILSSFASIF